MFPAVGGVRLAKLDHRCAPLYEQCLIQPQAHSASCMICCFGDNCHREMIRVRRALQFSWRIVWRSVAEDTCLIYSSLDVSYFKQTLPRSTGIPAWGRLRPSSWRSFLRPRTCLAMMSTGWSTHCLPKTDLALACACQLAGTCPVGVTAYCLAPTLRQPCGRAELIMIHLRSGFVGAWSLQSSAHLLHLAVDSTQMCISKLVLMAGAS